MMPLLALLLMMVVAWSLLRRLPRPIIKQPVLFFIVMTILVAMSLLYVFFGHPLIPASYHASQRDAQMRALAIPLDILPNMEQLARQLKKDPHDRQAWHMLGQAYSLSGQYNRARLTYERALILYPDDIALLSLYSQLLIQLKDPHGEVVFRQLLAQTDDEQQLLQLIQRSMELGAIKQARDALRQLNDRFPEGGRGRAFLGDSLQLLESE